jgi:hypothetical protein
MMADRKHGENLLAGSIDAFLSHLEIIVLEKVLMKKFVLFAMLAGIGALLTGEMVIANPKAAPEPQNSIKDVMKKAHKDGLLKKVLAGEGDDADKKMLLDLYIDLVENKPEKGERADWIMAAGPVVVAAGKVVVGRDGAIEELKTATNCKACHDVFK